MRDHQQAAMVFRCDALEDILHDGTVAAIEVAGGLVAHEDERIVDERPRDGHTLLLATTDLVGHFTCLMIDAHGAQVAHGPFLQFGTREKRPSFRPGRMMLSSTLNSEIR